MTNKYYNQAESIEIVRKIESYGARYNSDSGLSLEDQLLACEAVAESAPVIEHNETKNPPATEGEASLRSSSSSACYLKVNDKLADSLHSAIEQLVKLDYKSSRYEIAEILQKTFGDPRKEGHWLWCAQNYTPRPIIRTIAEIYRSLLLGKWAGQTPADFFTFLLKKRQRRAKIKKEGAHA